MDPRPLDPDATADRPPDTSGPFIAGGGRSGAADAAPARTRWIGTSWKMTKTIPEALEYIDELLATPLPDGVRAFVLPPHTALAAVRDRIPPGHPLLLGAQNAHFAPEGAGTGEISMRMAKDAGAILVEMGHSERRQAFGETDETVARKARAALDHGLTPLICVGEPSDIRDDGRAEEFVSRQVRAATALLAPEEIPSVLVAYEPVWAIGVAGRPAAPEEVTPVMAALTMELAGRSAGRGCRALLYGGSVDQGNGSALLADAHTDGLFVGRAAWTPRGFAQLLRLGASASGHS
jgi:triosephosphate isomerase